MFATLLYLIGAGLGFMVAVSPLSAIPRHVTRTHARVALGVIVLAGASPWLVRSASTDLPLGLQAASLAAILSMLALSIAAERNLGGAGAVRVSAALSAAAAWVASMAAAGAGAPTQPPLPGLLLSTALAALVLGAITYSWLLGHAYLTATRMTIQPLKSASYWVFLAMIARCATAAVSLLVLSQVSRVFAHLMWEVTGAALLGLRLGVGLMGGLVLGWMALDCVRHRNTQSATGVLYFASVLVYMGELSAIYLWREWGWMI